MSIIDKIIEREFGDTDNSDSGKLVFGKQELRAILQEVHDAAVAECGKDAERYRTIKELWDFKPAGYDGCKYGRWDCLIKTEESDMDKMVDEWTASLAKSDAAIAAAKEK